MLDSISNNSSSTNNTVANFGREIVIHILSGVFTVVIYAILFFAIDSTLDLCIAILVCVTIFYSSYAIITEAATLFLSEKSSSLNTVREFQPSVDAVRPPLAIPLMIRSVGDLVAARNCLSHVCSVGCYSSISAIVLLVDFPDCDSKVDPKDTELAVAIQEVVDVASASCAVPILIYFRERTWNDVDQKWMGWERKRGKIVEFLSFIRGFKTSYIGVYPEHLMPTEYIMTIDIDTWLGPDTIEKLILALDARRDIAIATPALMTLDQLNEPLDRFLVEPSFYQLNEPETAAMQMVFGYELFYGKGLIRVDRFLASTASIPSNCVLSHDHLESLLGGACSVASARIYEPFPATRHAWECRQHRWYRGDFQIAPWSFLGCSSDRKLHGELAWPARSIATRLSLNPVNIVINYITIVLLSFVNHASAGIVFFLLIIISEKGGIISVISLVRRYYTQHKTEPPLRVFKFYIFNSFARTIGAIVYFQRNAIIAILAISLVAWRLKWRGGRKILEWHPDKPNRIIIVRRTVEAGIVLTLGIYCLGFGHSSVPFIITGGWLLCGSIVSRCYIQHRVL